MSLYKIEIIKVLFIILFPIVIPFVISGIWDLKEKKNRKAVTYHRSRRCKLDQDKQWKECKVIADCNEQAKALKNELDKLNCSVKILKEGLSGLAGDVNGKE